MFENESSPLLARDSHTWMLRSEQRLFISKTYCTPNPPMRRRLLSSPPPFPSACTLARDGNCSKPRGLIGAEKTEKNPVLLPTAFAYPAPLLLGQMHAFSAVIPHHSAQVARALPFQLIILVRACYRLIISRHPTLTPESDSR